MSVAQLDTLYSDAVAALDAGQYDLAIRKAVAAKARLGTMPNVSRAVGSGSSALAWSNAAAIDAFIAEVRKLKAQSLAEASGGIQQTKVHYVRPAPSDDF